MFICASPLGEAQLNRMLDRCRPLGPASPTGRVNTWPSSTLTPASTADLRPRPTCSATSASVLLRFIRWCSRLSVKVGYERSPASPAASRCSSIPNACLSYANLNPSNPLGRGTSAVIADDVDDQRVIQLAHVLHLLDDPTDLVIRIGGVSSEHFGLTGKQLFLVG